MNSLAVGAEKKALSVAEFIVQLNSVLGAQHARIKGEIISFKVSGAAVYYTIKDGSQEAKLDCMTWMSTYRANGISLKVGDEIIITGAPNIYAPYGRFSFRANTIEYAGEGDLKRAFEQLKARLEAEGLLQESRKRALPLLPKRIGVITSMSSGVVIHDFSSNLNKHGYKILTCDSKVEGKEAVLDILASIHTMAKQEIDILVVIRGGGAPESFQAFNTESVVRAVAGFKVPVITGIGHDTDITLTQLVADFGASTPTGVAATLNAQWEGLVSKIKSAESNILGRFQSSVHEKYSYVNHASVTVTQRYHRQVSGAQKTISDASLKTTSVFRNLTNRVVTVNASLQVVTGTMRTILKSQRIYLNKAPGKLASVINITLQQAENRISTSRDRLLLQQKQAINIHDSRLKEFERLIGIYDPAHNLKLGYSISYVNGKIARQLQDVKEGDILTTVLANGDLISEVKELK